MFKLQEILNAVSVFAAKKDVRYYLNGICMYHKCGKILHLAATNGHYLVVVSNNLEHADLQECEQSIICPEDIKKLNVLHGKEPISTFNLNSFSFTSVDGRYPDITRVIPADNRVCDMSYGIALNMDYIALPQKFLTKLLKGRRKSAIEKSAHLTFGTAYSPVKIDKTISELDIKITIMPTRL